MLTKEQYDLLKAKKAEELTDEEKASIVEFDKSLTDEKNKVPSTWDEIFKHPRFKELDTKAKEAQAALKKIQDDQANAETEALKAANNWKGLYDKAQETIATLQPKATLADSMEKTLEASLNAQIAEIPETMRKLVPSMLNTSQKLEWLSENKTLLMKPSAFDIAAGKTGGEAPNTASLTADEIATAQKAGMTPEEYLKNK